LGSATFKEKTMTFEIGVRVQPRGGGFVEGELVEFNADGTGALIRWDNGDHTWKALRNLDVIAEDEAATVLPTHRGGKSIY
jgi:hypothetical protein